MTDFWLATHTPSTFFNFLTARETPIWIASSKLFVDAEMSSVTRATDIDCLLTTIRVLSLFALSLASSARAWKKTPDYSLQPGSGRLGYRGNTAIRGRI